MRRFFGSVIDNPHRWALAALAVAFGLVLWLDLRPAVQAWGRSPERIAGDVMAHVLPVVQVEIQSTRRDVLAEVRSQATGIRQDLFGEVKALRADVLGPDGRFVALQSAVLGRADEGLAIIKDLRKESLTPLLAAAAGTVTEIGTVAKTYNVLPDRLGAELRPSWLALQPEITCRQADGTGYGGCWHSRITGLMGEAVRVGGVFTKKFPSLADSMTGMASDGRAWTNKYVMPHPMTRGQKFKAAGKVMIGLGGAYLRGGGL